MRFDKQTEEVLSRADSEESTSLQVNLLDLRQSLRFNTHIPPSNGRCVKPYSRTPVRAFFRNATNNNNTFIRIYIYAFSKAHETTFLTLAKRSFRNCFHAPYCEAVERTKR